MELLPQLVHDRRHFSSSDQTGAEGTLKRCPQLVRPWEDFTFKLRPKIVAKRERFPVLSPSVIFVPELRDTSDVLVRKLRMNLRLVREQVGFHQEHGGWKDIGDQVLARDHLFVDGPVHLQRVERVGLDAETGPDAHSHEDGDCHYELPDTQGHRYRLGIDTRAQSCGILLYETYPKQFQGCACRGGPFTAIRRRGVISASSPRRRATTVRSLIREALSRRSLASAPACERRHIFE